MFNRSILGAGVLLAAVFVPGLAIAHSAGFVAPSGSHVVTVVAREYRFTVSAK
ncbi:MAG: hypothetical protein ACRET2_03490 [Steroidobacteraceae bacterium]